MTTNTIDNTEELKKIVINQEEKKDYKSEKFIELEKIVKDFLLKQDTDNTLKAISMGALKLGSSDVHFDNFENETVVRFRIDGILVDIFSLDKKQYKLLLERLKHSASLKLNITNIPQDGKYSMELNDDKIDVRVSSLPTAYGENIVARILDSKKTIINFEDLGFYWTTKRMLEKAITKKNGMILVTGPTGSGKTTSLYTILSKLNTRDKKIITLEDPIEYRLDGIVQSEVNEKNNYTYNMGLKALLRQDPDVIMLGEIRDLETLNIATQASLTGHLVLSTLHTKSASETLTRIINMGLKPYILASSLDIIIAQRLVRKVCPYCREEIEKTPEEINLIKSMTKDIGMKALPAEKVKLFKGKGCEHCNNSGYKGRVGIYEILTINEKLRELIRDGKTTEEIIAEARKMDMITMKEDGFLKAFKGDTTLQEVMRVI